MQAILTLYESDYHYGVAALVNSAVGSGFKGVCVIGYRDRLPPWLSCLQRIGEDDYIVECVRIRFYREQPSRHLAFQKPFSILAVLDRYPEIETIYYADPDVAILAPWEFFEKWSEEGVCLVRDANFPQVCEKHPWRRAWRDLIRDAGVSLENPSSTEYANAGFIGIKRTQRQFLENWQKITITYEEMGGETQHYVLRDRWRAILSDQDLLAATIMAWAGDVSMLGPEAMGFTGHFFILSHAIENPKPWAKSYLAFSLKGFAPTQAAKRYLQCSVFPIRPQSRLKTAVKKWEFRCAQLISRFYRRSA